ncbi:MAG: hypothetical protein GKR94_09190 [Gammaproteobacteria bacterium]|nr:hypothetical protein [Gammaproteobacteria bacterium]
MLLNVDIDRTMDGKNALGYPAFAGFELEDLLYLLAPITWLRTLVPFFALARIDAIVYLAWTFACLVYYKGKT